MPNRWPWMTLNPRYLLLSSPLSLLHSFTPCQKSIYFTNPSRYRLLILTALFSSTFGPFGIFMSIVFMLLCYLCYARMPMALLERSQRHSALGCVRPWVCKSVSRCLPPKTLWTPYLNKCLASAKRPCDCSVLCLRLKSSLCSCAHYFRHDVIRLSWPRPWQWAPSALNVNVKKL